MKSFLHEKKFYFRVTILDFLELESENKKNRFYYVILYVEFILVSNDTQI